MTTTYSKLKQKFNVFKINEEIISLFKSKDIFQIILDAVNNKDEINALFLINEGYKYEYTSDKKYEITDHMKLLIMKAASLNLLKDVYWKFFPKLTAKSKLKLYESVKDCNDEDVFIFLYKEKLFTTKELNDTLYNFKFKRLHEHMKVSDLNYEINLSGVLATKIISEEYDDVLFFVQLGNKLGFGYSEFFRHQKYHPIEDLYERGMFVNDLDKMLFQSILHEKDDLINFFIEKGAKLENIKDDIDKKFESSCRTGKVSEVTNLLKYNPDINNKIKLKNDCIDGMNSSKLHKDKQNYAKIAVLLLENSNEEYLTYNFIRLLHYLKLENISDMYNEGFRLDLKHMGYITDRFVLEKDKLSLLNELDENFIDFVNMNLYFIEENCDEEALEYLETIL